jgi:protein Mpv17
MRYFVNRLKNIKINYIHRRNAGGSSSGAGDGFYSNAMQKQPIITSAITAMILWGTGDLIAQQLENNKNEKTNQTLKLDRLSGTLVHGTFVGGIGSYIWYNQLDKFVSRIFKAGTSRFVLAKVSLELLIWHPVSLLCYWTLVGLCEGHAIDKIKKELLKDFLITWACDGGLWIPVDVMTFWFIPLKYQVMFVSCGSLIEAIALSYIHGGSDSDDNDSLEEIRCSIHVLKYKFKFLDNLFSNLTKKQILTIASTEFDNLDKGHRGYLEKDNLKYASLLPGIYDSKVNDKVLSILYKKMDIDEDNKISKDEYLRMIECLHSTGYKKSLIPDVIFSLFDKDGNNQLDLTELSSFVQLYNDESDKQKVQNIVREIIQLYDKDGDGKISLHELKALLKEKREI